MSAAPTASTAATDGDQPLNEKSTVNSADEATIARETPPTTADLMGDPGWADVAKRTTKPSLTHLMGIYPIKRAILDHIKNTASAHDKIALLRVNRAWEQSQVGHDTPKLVRYDGIKITGEDGASAKPITAAYFKRPAPNEAISRQELMTLLNKISESTWELGAPVIFGPSASSEDRDLENIYHCFYTSTFPYIPDQPDETSQDPELPLSTCPPVFEVRGANLATAIWHFQACAELGETSAAFASYCAARCLLFSHPTVSDSETNKDTCSPFRPAPNALHWSSISKPPLVCTNLSAASLDDPEAAALFAVKTAMLTRDEELGLRSGNFVVTSGLSTFPWTPSDTDTLCTAEERQTKLNGVSKEISKLIDSIYKDSENEFLLPADPSCVLSQEGARTWDMQKHVPLSSEVKANLKDGIQVMSPEAAGSAMRATWDTRYSVPKSTQTAQQPNSGLEAGENDGSVQEPEAATQ